MFDPDPDPDPDSLSPHTLSTLDRRAALAMAGRSLLAAFSLFRAGQLQWLQTQHHKQCAQGSCPADGFS